MSTFVLNYSESIEKNTIRILPKKRIPQPPPNVASRCTPNYVRGADAINLVANCERNAFAIECPHTLMPDAFLRLNGEMRLFFIRE